MPFSGEDKYLIQFYRKTRHLGAHRIIKLSRQLDKKWTLSGLQRLLTQIDETGNLKRRLASQAAHSLVIGTKLISS